MLALEPGLVIPSELGLRVHLLGHVEVLQPPFRPFAPRSHLISSYFIPCSVVFYGLQLLAALRQQSMLWVRMALEGHRHLPPLQPALHVPRLRGDHVQLHAGRLERRIGRRELRQLPTAGRSPGAAEVHQHGVRLGGEVDAQVLQGLGVEVHGKKSNPLRVDPHMGIALRARSETLSGSLGETHGGDASGPRFRRSIGAITMGADRRSGRAS